MTGGASVTEEAPVRCPCGRLLTDPVSQARGLGPVCYRRLRARTRPRARIIGTRTAGPHPAAVPARVTTQLEFELWDGEDIEDLFYRRPLITDVPTGALL